MSTKTNPALDRRSALRIGAVGAAATAATVAVASNAEAAAGQAVIQGATNTVGTASTILQSNGAAITLQVKNTGAGAGAFFFAQNNNGFAGGTAAANKYGLSAANSGAAGGGAGMAASGINNTGVLANTNNADRFALKAVNFSGIGVGTGAGVWAEGGQTPGVIAISNIGVPAAISVGDTIYTQGHEVVVTANSVVFGATSANGPEVSFSGNIVLDADGAGVVDLVGPTFGPTWNDVDADNNTAFATARTGPMPGLWVQVEPAGSLTVHGGTPGGTVSWRVIGVRNDWESGLSAGGARTSRVVTRARELVAGILKRTGR